MPILTRVSTTRVSLLVLLATIGLYLWNTTPPGVATVDISAPAEFNEFTPSMVLSSAPSPASSSKLVTLLLAGTDSRDGLDKNLYGPFSGDRPDSIVLILTIPGTKTVLVSIPRDLIVTDVCTGEKMRINATFTACRSWSGPGRFEATVSRNTGLPVATR